MLPIFLRYSFSHSPKTLLTLKPPLGIITLNSPQDKNCLSIQMNHQLSQSITTLSHHPSINLILLTSSIPSLFSSGGPLKYFYNATSSTFHNNDIFQSLQQSLNTCSKPIITVVNGVILGGAFEMALGTDMILCSKSSKFGMTQMKLGLSSVLGGAQRLGRMVGKGETGRIYYGAGLVKAERMWEMGLVTEVFEDEGFEERVMEYCGRIAEKGQEELIEVRRRVRAAEQDQQYKR